MTGSGGEQVPRTQPAFSGRPPRPPNATARALEDQPGEPRRTVYLLDPMLVRDLALVLQLKPFKVVADLMQMKLLKTPDDPVDYAIASAVARKHGFRPEKAPPGMLVL